MEPEDRNLRKSLFEYARQRNSWFTRENIELAIRGLINYLDETKFNEWVNRYSFQENTGQRVGIVMAGNIPMVGIHDFICVLTSGHNAVIKLSSQDDVLIPFIIEKLIDINPRFNDRIEIVDQLQNISAVIATGSDNTARYFNYYFGKYPNIIRMNRTSVAILNGKETAEEKTNLSRDIFSYFGLGCRNVSKIFLPNGYDLAELIAHFGNYDHLSNHNKYSNNYYYNKSILLVNNTAHIDGEFVLLQKSEKLVSPVSMIYYEFYSDTNQLNADLKRLEHKIQCIVTNMKEFDNTVYFGGTQKPEIWDYADNIDTMEFLATL